MQSFPGYYCTCDGRLFIGFLGKALVKTALSFKKILIATDVINIMGGFNSGGGKAPGT